MTNVKLPDLTGQKILITGGYGFIGSNLAHRCVELGASVSILDCLEPRSGGNLYNVHSIKSSITTYSNNILNFDRLSEIVVGQDIVINCAASTSHSTSMSQPWHDQNINSKGMINTLEAIRRFNPSCKFIHIGTSTQLGKMQYEPADEMHPEFPTDIYSANKSVSEKYALIYANAYNIDATVLRLSNVYGPRASIHSPEFTFNNFFVGLSLQDKAITVFGEGDQKRNIIYIDDAVDGIVLISQESQSKGEVYFLVGDEHYSVAEIAEATVKYIGQGSVCYVPWPKGRKQIDVGNAVLSNMKFKSLCSWSPRFTISTGMTATKMYFQSCLQHYLR